jgi:hypothetical protein
MNEHLFQMLKCSAEADKSKAELSLKILSDSCVGIGDHSTKDLWDNAEEALALLENATSRLELLEKLDAN